MKPKYKNSHCNFKKNPVKRCTSTRFAWNLTALSVLKFCPHIPGTKLSWPRGPPTDMTPVAFSAVGSAAYALVTFTVTCFWQVGVVGFIIVILGQGSFYVWTQPMRDNVTLWCCPSLAEPLHRMIPVDEWAMLPGSHFWGCDPGTFHVVKPMQLIRAPVVPVLQISCTDLLDLKIGH